MRRVLILAQGRQERLADLGYPKQLLEIAPGETILGRTLRLLAEADQTTDVVGSPAIHGVTCHFQMTNPIILADPGFCILDGLAQVLPSDGRSALVLLGDVVYSRAAMKTILEQTAPIFFFGTPKITPSTGELFAFGFDAASWDLVTRAIRDAPCRRSQSPKGQPGHLRHLLKALLTALYVPSCDWTNDIDTPEDVRDVLPKLVAACAAEEKS